MATAIEGSAADSSGSRIPEDSRAARSLVSAARDGDVCGLERLLDEQMWPPSILSRLGHATGYTALGLACNRGHHDIAELLLRRRANPDVPLCQNGATPLMVATIWDRREIVQSLLRHGATIDATAAPRMGNGYKEGTALDVARQRGRGAIADLLVRERATRRLRRLRRPTFLAGHFLLALSELYAEIHYRPDGLGARLAQAEFFSTAAAAAVAAVADEEPQGPETAKCVWQCSG